MIRGVMEMKKIAKYIVTFRIPILIISFLLLIPSAIGYINLKINYDILTYLPEDIETMKGQDILLDEFGKGAYGMLVCKGLNSADSIKLAEYVKEIEHVASVISYDSLTDGMLPSELLPDQMREIFYSDKDQTSLMFIFFDSTTSADETMNAIQELRSVAGRQCFLSSMSCIASDTKDLVESEMFIYTAIAVVLCLLVLFVTTDSFVIPLLFILSIGMSIIYNLGTNWIQGDMSYITMALVAILQLGVTMDYSIFLYHSYQEAKQYHEDNRDAMADAIAATFASVTGSSLTTIAGFLAMCFMSFTLGLDMGVVMAKGVAFGVLTCVTVLPSLILVFDKLITKTSHRPLQLRTEGISRFILKYHLLFLAIMLVVWIPAIYGNNHVDVYYKLDESLPEDLPSRQGNLELEEHFDMNSVSMALIDSKLPGKTTKELLNDLKQVEGVSFAIGLDSVTGSMIPEDFIPAKLRENFTSEHWKLLLISSEYQVATDEINDQCETIEKIIKSYHPSGMFIGEAPATKDLVRITAHDFNVVNFVSIGAIFVLIFLVLRSVSLPVILVLVIEFAIYVNMALSYYMGNTLPFIASVCIGTIQLGATVDYAILMTTRYKKERTGGLDKKQAISTALSSSIHSIFSSALGFFAATIGVAVYSDVDLIGAICMLLARGAILSMIIVLTMLPTLLYVFDGIICRTTMGMSHCLRDQSDQGQPAVSYENVTA